MEQIEIQKEFEKINELLTQNNIDFKNLTESDKKIIKNYIKKNPKLKNMAEQIYKTMEKYLNKELRIGISGIAGLGKSQLLTNLFGIELPISRTGTGTTHQITKETYIEFLKLIIDDLQGLGDAEIGHETSFDHNNDYIHCQLISKDHLLIQGLDFRENRSMVDEKTQLKNIIRMIDFSKPEDEYLKIISKKIYIIFLRANQFSSDEVEEKKKEINNFLLQFHQEEINQKQKEKLNDLFKEINLLFENQYQLQIKKIKGMINEILKEENGSLSPESRQKIIDSISFSYAGNNCKMNNQPSTIPDKEDFVLLKIPNLKDYKFTPWCENWRFDIFNKIFSKVDDTQAYSLNLAIKERAKIIEEKSSDPHKIKEANAESYLKLNKEAEKSIKKGFCIHFKTAIIQLCGTSVGMSYIHYFLTGIFTFVGLTTLASWVPYYTGLSGVAYFFDYLKNEWGVFKD